MFYNSNLLVIDHCGFEVPNINCCLIKNKAVKYEQCQFIPRIKCSSQAAMDNLKTKLDLTPFFFELFHRALSRYHMRKFLKANEIVT